MTKHPDGNKTSIYVTLNLSPSLGLILSSPLFTGALVGALLSLAFQFFHLPLVLSNTQYQAQVTSLE